MSGRTAYPNIECFDPRSCISGRVMRLARITAGVFRKYLQPFDVTDSQVSILFILSKNVGFTQQRLSEIARLEKSSLSRNLKRLYDNELLAKDEGGLVSLTVKGKGLVEEIIPEWEKAMHEVRALLDQDGEQALSIVLDKLTNTEINK